MLSEPVIKSQRGESSAFRPPLLLRNPVLQTVLSSMRWRNRGVTGFELASAPVIVDAGGGVRLLGSHSPAPLIKEKGEAVKIAGSSMVYTIGEDRAGSTGGSNSNGGGKGLVILLHGWEGSESSAYMVSAGRFFHFAGYDVFRLNLRDHGSSHHLNKGLFLGTLIDEAYGAVKQIISDYAMAGRVYIIGFSMGANFALRIARKAGDEAPESCPPGLPCRTETPHTFSPAKRITGVIAVNPPLDPHTATLNIDRYSIIRKYFLKKWKRSLERKENAFPQLYDFKRFSSAGSCMELTRLLLAEYTDYKSAEDYFSRYTLAKDFFGAVRVPVSVITAADDPVIDVSGFSAISESGNSKVRLFIEPYGGHCAYIRNYRLDTWLFDMLSEVIEV